MALPEAIERITRLLRAQPDGLPLARCLPVVPPEAADRPLRLRAALASTLVAGLELAREGTLELDQIAAFCSFLALVLRKELDACCRKAGFRPEWGDVLRDLDRLQEVEIAKDGRRMTLRTPAIGVLGPLFKAAGIALPPNIRDPAAT